MLKNLSPLLTGALLRALDSAPQGAWIAVVSGGRDASGIPVGGEFEHVVRDVLSVTPLATAPLVVERGMELTDEGFAVLGLAADAEGRSIELLPVSDVAFAELLNTATVRILVRSSDPVGVLMCKGAC